MNLSPSLEFLTQFYIMLIDTMRNSLLIVVFFLFALSLIVYLVKVIKGDEK